MTASARRIDQHRVKALVLVLKLSKRALQHAFQHRQIRQVIEGGAGTRIGNRAWLRFHSHHARSAFGEKHRKKSYPAVAIKYRFGAPGMQEADGALDQHGRLGSVDLKERASRNPKLMAQH